VPNWAPTLEYVAIPLGSSSAAPVINPGPNSLNVFPSQPEGLEEAGALVATLNLQLSVQALLGCRVRHRQVRFLLAVNSLVLFAIKQQMDLYCFHNDNEHSLIKEKARLWSHAQSSIDGMSKSRGTPGSVLEITGMFVVVHSDQFNGWQQLHDSYFNGYPDSYAMGSKNSNAVPVKLLKPDLH
jgi:hypothetical protein